MTPIWTPCMRILFEIRSVFDEDLCHLYWFWNRLLSLFWLTPASFVTCNIVFVLKTQTFQEANITHPLVCNWSIPNGKKLSTWKSFERARIWAILVIPAVPTPANTSNYGKPYQQALVHRQMGRRANGRWWKRGKGQWGWEITGKYFVTNTILCNFNCDCACWLAISVRWSSTLQFSMTALL